MSLSEPDKDIISLAASSSSSSSEDSLGCSRILLPCHNHPVVPDIVFTFLASSESVRDSTKVSDDVTFNDVNAIVPASSDVMMDAATEEAGGTKSASASVSSTIAASCFNLSFDWDASQVQNLRRFLQFSRHRRDGDRLGRAEATPTKRRPDSARLEEYTASGADPKRRSGHTMRVSRGVCI